jgi:hypothetical protein
MIALLFAAQVLAAQPHHAEEQATASTIDAIIGESSDVGRRLLFSLDMKSSLPCA